MSARGPIRVQGHRPHAGASTTWLVVDSRRHGEQVASCLRRDVAEAIADALATSEAYQAIYNYEDAF